MDNTFIWTILLYLLFDSPYIYGDDKVNCKNEVRCPIRKAHGMKVADCYDKDFKYFPKCISTDVEVIELSYNRITKLSKTDLSRFKYLKILYLTENKISNLHAEVFKDV